MSDLARFLERFVRPLVEGGDVHVGAPLDEARVVAWRLELGGHAEPLVAIDEARARVVAPLVVRPPPLVFGDDELRLAAALHDVLALHHPRAEGWLARRARRAVHVAARALAAVDPPVGRGSLLARHALLHDVLRLVRTDTRVSWWTGVAEFRGEPPPRRLVRWRTLRRVREERLEVPVAEVLGGDAGGDVLALLLAASPLTDLLEIAAPARAHPPFTWADKDGVLADPELARAVAYRWLDPGASSSTGDGVASALARLRAPAAAAAAWDAELERLPPRTLRAATAFLVHLDALLAIGEAADRDEDVDRPSPLLATALAASPRAFPDAAAATGLRILLALPDLVREVEPALSAPTGLDADERIARRWAAHRAQARGALPEPRLAALVERLRVRLGAGAGATERAATPR